MSVAIRMKYRGFGRILEKSRRPLILKLNLLLAVPRIIVTKEFTKILQRFFRFHYVLTVGIPLPRGCFESFVEFLCSWRFTSILETEARNSSFRGVFLFIILLYTVSICKSLEYFKKTKGRDEVEKK